MNTSSNFTIFQRRKFFMAVMELFVKQSGRCLKNCSMVYINAFQMLPYKIIPACSTRPWEFPCSVYTDLRFEYFRFVLQCRTISPCNDEISEICRTFRYFKEIFFGNQKISWKNFQFFSVMNFSSKNFFLKVSCKCKT